jgi:hypothetical protein
VYGLKHNKFPCANPFRILGQAHGWKAGCKAVDKGLQGGYQGRYLKKKGSGP